MPSRIEPQDIGTRCWMITSVPFLPAWLIRGGMATSHLLPPSVGEGEDGGELPPYTNLLRPDFAAQIARIWQFAKGFRGENDDFDLVR
jgi:hypothetical protein